jgi:hypothetical protein
MRPDQFVPVEEHGFTLEVFDVTKDDGKTLRWVRAIHPDGHVVCSYMAPTPVEALA